MTKYSREFLGIGFDLRKKIAMVNSKSSQKKSNRSEKFYLSIDRMICPSLIHQNDLDCTEKDRPIFNNKKAFICENNFNSIGNIISLDSLTRFVSSPLKMKGTVIYVSVLVKSLTPLSTTNIGYPLKAAFSDGNNFGDKPLIFRFLGYDVACAEQFSSVSNFGFAEKSPSEFNFLWRRKLNLFGLFNSISVAERYCDYSFEKVKSHGKFYVYKIVECVFS